MWKQCEYCGDWFESEHGNRQICPECKRECKRIRTPRMHIGPTDVLAYERALRIRNTENHRDTIVAEGYADRQRAKTLALVSKIEV